MRPLQLPFLLAILIPCAVQAQPVMPFTGTNYQAVVRNANGDPLPYQSVGVQFTVTWGLAIAYQETQQATTDGQGVLSLRVGDGSSTGIGQFGSFEQIEWYNATFFGLITAVDITGGTNYVELGWSELYCVPFAALSREALMLSDSGWVSVPSLFSDPKVYSAPSYLVGVGTSSPVNKLDVEGAVVIGSSYSGSSVAPVDGLLVQGRVGIGTTTPGSYSLLCNGSAAKPGGGSWTSSSDLRLKKNIEPLHGALATMLALRGVTFEYKDPSSIHELPGRRTGFIAQDVASVVPDWVEEHDGYLRLTIRGFEAMTVEAMRELEAENRALRTELVALKQEQQDLWDSLRRMEARSAIMEPGVPSSQLVR